MRHPDRPNLTGFATLGLLALVLTAAACTLTTQAPSPDTDTTDCGSSQGTTYGIEQFPCSASTVEGFSGPESREHAWYLFAGLNQTDSTTGALTWRGWPTSYDIFKVSSSTSRAGSGVGSSSSTSSLLAATQDAGSPGAILEHPAPGTPRTSGLATSGTDVQELALPGGPCYNVPADVLANLAYTSCIETVSSMSSDGLCEVTHTLQDGPLFQNNGDILIAGVVYSPDIETYINGQDYADGSVLDALVPTSASSSSNATGVTMPTNSVVLKTMLWPVPGGSDEWVALPLWDNLLPCADEQAGADCSYTSGSPCERYAGFERRDLWGRAVALNAADQSVGDQVSAELLQDSSVTLATGFDWDSCEATGYSEVSYEYGATAVSLDDFYSFTYTDAELSAMNPCDRALLDQSAYWAYGRAFESQDALVLVAMHMMTKEQPDWTFQSAWWYDTASDCDSSDTQCQRYAKDRPTDISGSTWQNYLMTTTYGFTQKPGQTNTWPPDLSTDNTDWPVAYNPYIEMAANHPVETNCINCHRRAAWPSRLTSNASEEYPDRSSAYLTSGTDAPDVLETFETDNAIFDGLLMLDNMWAIADRAGYSTGTATGSATEATAAEK